MGFMGTGGPQKEEGEEGAPPNEMAEAAAGWARYAAWASSRAMQAAKDAAELSTNSMESAKTAQEKIAKLMGNEALAGDGVTQQGFSFGPELLPVVSGACVSANLSHSLKLQCGTTGPQVLSLPCRCVGAGRDGTFL